MEDCSAVNRGGVGETECILFSVFDGHCGAQAAEYCRERLPLLVLGSEHFGGSDAAARRALTDGFALCEEGLVATQVNSRPSNRACARGLACRARSSVPTLMFPARVAPNRPQQPHTAPARAHRQEICKDKPPSRAQPAAARQVRVLLLRLRRARAQIAVQGGLRPLQPPHSRSKALHQPNTSTAQLCPRVLLPPGARSEQQLPGCRFPM